jgi:ribosome recycling factor
MNNYLLAKQEDFVSIIDFFKKDISSLRTGRANAGMLDSLKVDAYGTLNSISAVGNVSTPDARCLVITPWDKSIAKSIEKAVIDAGLGFGVVNEGDKIRLTIPPLTEENRKDLVKKLNERMEKARISLRQAREEVKGAIEEAEEAKEISEDEKFRAVKELDEYIGAKNDEIRSIRDKKEQDIMEI